MAAKEVPFPLGPPELGLTISAPLGVGLWAWGDSATWGYGSYDSQVSEQSFKDAYQASIDAGVDFFDTAEVYGAGLTGGWGVSEAFLGRFVAGSPPESRPVVASKYLPLPWRVRQPACLLGVLRSSLARLQLPAVDLYQIHSPVASCRSVEAHAEALAAAVDAGLARAVGVSNYSEDEMRRAHAVLKARGVPLATNQVEFSLLRRLPETGGLLAAAAELGVTLLAYSPLAMGRLTGKYSAQSPPKGSRRFGAEPWDVIDPLVAALREVGGAQSPTRSPAQVALNWIICKGAVPIPGAKNAEQARQNAGAVGWRLTPAQVAQLDTLAVEGTCKLGQHG